MDIPEDVVKASAQKLWDADDPTEWDDLASSYRAELMTVAEAAMAPVVEWARKQTLLDAVDAIEGIVVMPVGDHVGYYEAGLEEATDAVRALGESR